MKFILLKESKEPKMKEGTVFEWSEDESAYTTKSLPWFLTPMIDKQEMKERIKLKQFRKRDK